tara:strand:- start:4864 stop:5010 length:147 start_codon:yes stop_codon:yes gene_type:complete
MKKFIFAILILLILGATQSCNPDDIRDSIPSYSTGDEVDDPAEPDEDK